MCSLGSACGTVTEAVSCPNCLTKPPAPLAMCLRCGSSGMWEGRSHWQSLPFSEAKVQHSPTCGLLKGDLLHLWAPWASLRLQIHAPCCLHDYWYSGCVAAKLLRRARMFYTSFYLFFFFSWVVQVSMVRNNEKLLQLFFSKLKTRGQGW